MGYKILLPNFYVPFFNEYFFYAIKRRRSRRSLLLEYRGSFSPWSSIYRDLVCNCSIIRCCISGYLINRTNSKRWQNFMESVLEFTQDIAKNQLGESLYRPWVPFISTLFLFIFGCNWAGALIPWKVLELPEGELAAPTNDINTTVALSLLVSIFYFYGGLRKKGLGYFKRYIQPTPILLPINILEDFTKPLSLSFRLFGNVLADELTVSVLVLLVPLIVPLPIMGLGVFASSVQALIFSTLAAAYIAEAVE